MGLLWKSLIIIVGVLAVLAGLEVPRNKWISTKSLLLKSSTADAFAFVTSLDYVNKWFPFVHRVKEADGKQLGVGKQLYAVYDVPFYGEYSMVYVITDFKPEKLIVVEGNNFLKPKIEFHFIKIKEKESKMSISVSFQKLSYAFQYTLGPVFYFLINQKLQHALFLLQAVFPY